ncbi:uncharacterized protein Z520_03446 [Fonsecaea multimorphosa CBS 102226]|uniref:Uncharacterized protein n=1 Tax=Fonsecaea multimorphosa CBS 102226 TaxID=1442371 RepID=A0A0D2HFT9_9EURO|nr:uncharacterized protein Z520_03446 [Fonsecaea multimorphosa CBS 102226]KIY00781.1 hypothetical protein Z520_03446 [Fonsecaea multimorphosa CBS 102226]
MAYDEILYWRDYDIDSVKEAPRFQYQEIFEDNRVYRGTTTGGGIFNDADPDQDVTAGLQNIAFSVEKNRPSQEILVRVHSPTLRFLLLEALRSAELNGPSALDHVLTLDLPTLLQNYTALRSLFEREAAQRPKNWSLLELRLLACDFLLDRSIYVGCFDLDLLHSRGLLSYAHWNDMQQWEFENDLAYLDRLLSLSVEPVATERWRDHPPAGSEGQESALTLAIKSGDINSIQGLLEDTQVRVAAYDLSASLAADHLDIFWLLLAHGVELEDSDFVDQSIREQPIDVAAKRGHLQAVQALAMRGADVFSSRTIAAAAAEGHEHVVRYLLSLLPRHFVSFTDIALATAIKNGHLVIVLLLLDQPSRVLETQHLQFAVKHGHVEIAQVLFERLLSESEGLMTWEDIYQSTIPYETLLGGAARRGHIPMVRWLLQLNAPLHPHEKDSVLRVAIRSGDFNLVKEVWNIIPKSKVFHIGKGSLIDSTPDRWYQTWESETRNLSSFNRPALDSQRVESALVESLQDTHLDFLLKSRLLQVTTAFRNFAQNYCDYRDISKWGFAAIRKINKNRLPTSFKEIVCCLQLTRAMQDAGIAVGFDNEFKGICTTEE